MLATPVALAAWWSFDDADTTWFDDISGWGAHLSRTGATGEIARPPHRGAAFSMVGQDGLERGQTPILRSPTWTLEAWARQTNQRRGITESVIDDLDESGRRRLLAMDGEGHWVCRASRQDNFSLQVDAEVVVPEGTWSHAVCALSADELRLTVDNHNQTWILPTNGYVHEPSTDKIRLGRHPSVPDANFVGDIDEVRVYARALTIEEAGLPIPDGLAVGPAREPGTCGDDDGDDVDRCDDPPPDCDDTNPDVQIATEEVCDGIDNDCDGFVDEDTTPDGWVCVPATGPQGFTMGSPEDEPDRSPGEDQHNVIITRPMWVAETELTAEQYVGLVGGENPACPRCPMTIVSFLEACEFANRLSNADGLTPCYGFPGNEVVTWPLEAGCEGYRLPTEAEWEWMARAETTTSTYVGNFDTQLCRDDPVVNRVAWHCANSEQTVMEVGQLHPNAFGLFDMLGNVTERVFDGWTETPADLRIEDPLAPHANDQRVERGGSAFEEVQKSRAAHRNSRPFSGLDSFTGFRLVRTAPHAANGAD